VSEDGYVQLDAVASLEDVEALRAEIESLGAQRVSVYERVVSATLPVDTLDELSASMHLQLAQPALAVARAGLVISEGDIVMRGDAARNAFDVDGGGICVGLLSDMRLGGAWDIADYSPATTCS